jgi:hypothetical protein
VRGEQRDERLLARGVGASVPCEAAGGAAVDAVRLLVVDGVLGETQRELRVAQRGDRARARMRGIGVGKRIRRTGVRAEGRRRVVAARTRQTPVGRQARVVEHRAAERRQLLDTGPITEGARRRRHRDGPGGGDQQRRDAGADDAQGA